MSDTIVYIDKEEGISRVVNNAKLYTNLLLKFKNYTHLSEIEAALKEGELEKARNAAHTLKGLAANLSLKELYKQIMELEAQYKAGIINADQLEKVKTVFAQTIIEVDKVIAQHG